MEPQGISVGIDVSKAELAIAIHPSGERWMSQTTSDGIDEVVRRLISVSPTVIVVEATGGYERALGAACATQAFAALVARRRQLLEMLGAEQRRLAKSYSLARAPREGRR